MSTIKLKTCDDKVLDVDIEIAKCSGLIKNMVEDCGIVDDENAVVPLPNVRAEILEKILEWADYHKKHPEASKCNDYTDDSSSYICPWDKEFLKIDLVLLFELISVTNYLDVKDLLNVACQTVANMIKGKNPQEIRKTFCIENDMPKQEKLVIQPNVWELRK